MPEPANLVGAQTDRSIGNTLDAANRSLETVAADGQRTTSFLEWVLSALGMVRDALAITTAVNERVVPDPTDTILRPTAENRVRVPEL